MTRAIVNVLSFFRNAARNAQADVFMAQLGALAEAEQERAAFFLTACWGDSDDDTAGALRHAAARHRISMNLVEYHHGRPEFGSTEKPERLATLSKMANFALDRLPPVGDAVLYIESDLRWKPEAIGRLLTNVLDRGHDVSVPMVMAGGCFYDIWAYRLGVEGGEPRRFSPFPPFHPALATLPPGEALELDSAGSCLMMRPEVARAARMSDYALVSWCHAARALGYRIMLDPSAEVRQA